jgi:hypothetical protein
MLTEKDSELTTEDIESCMKVRDRLQAQVNALSAIKPAAGDRRYLLDCISLAAEAANALDKLIELHS